MCSFGSREPQVSEPEFPELYTPLSNHVHHACNWQVGMWVAFRRDARWRPKQGDTCEGEVTLEMTAHSGFWHRCDEAWADDSAGERI